MPETNNHSAVGHSAYLDLLRLHRDVAVSDIKGQVTAKTINGHEYLYDRYRLGARNVWHYLGEDTPELRTRVKRHSEIKMASKERSKEMSRRVKVLRSEGYATLDATTGSLLAAFAKSGVFRLGGTLVGTVAFQMYEAELGVVLGFDRMARTDDIDIASFERLSFALQDQVDGPLQDVFKGLKFEPFPSLEKGRVWRWKQASRETLVEFLTPSFGEEGIRKLPALGVSARALHHLNYLIAEPIPAVALYRGGILVQIPRPERYAIHKLIEADRRLAGVDSLKAIKDRLQAEFLIEVLNEQRPDELADAYDVALNSGPKWRARLEASLKSLPQSREILDGLIKSASQ